MMPAPDMGADIVGSLRRIMPPAAVVHVGVGRGTGTLHQWRNWDVETAWLVDAEPAQLAWTERLAATHPGWHVCPAMLAETDGQATYYRASNPAESGLVATRKLAALWPNLRETEHGEHATTCLDTLLAGTHELPVGAGWWLVVDCLPALRILQGAPATLERCSVLWLRALLQPLPDAEPGTTLEELQTFLAPLGFRCVQVVESNHPALGETLFVRDWAQRLHPVVAELHASNAQHQQQNQSLAARLATQEAAAQAAVQDRDEEAKLAAERQTQLNALSREKAELSGKLGQLEKDLAAATDTSKTMQANLAARTDERDAQAKLATERQTQLDALSKESAELSGKLASEAERNTELTRELGQLKKDLIAATDTLKTTHADLAARTGERDTQAKLAGERQAKLDALAKEKAELEKEHGTITDALKSAQSALAERTVERDAQAKLATERQTQLDALAKEKAELSNKLAAEVKGHTDVSAKLAQLEKDQAATSEALKAAQAELLVRTGERDTQAKLAGERQAKLDTLTKEKAELATKLDGQTKAQAELASKLASLENELGAKDAAIKAANADVAKHVVERDAKAKLAAERQGQIDALSKEKAALTEQLAIANAAKQDLAKRSDTLQGQVEQLTKARDEQAKLASDRATQLTQLTGQLDKLSQESQSLKSDLQARDATIAKQNEQIAEQDHRERQLVEEIVRAEAQIDLIKDLLLREGGL